MEALPVFAVISLTATSLAIINKLFALRTGKTLIQILVKKGAKKLNERQKIIVISGSTVDEFIDITEKVLELATASSEIKRH
jgi:hypothetical protein